MDKKKILLVDDDEKLCASLKTNLEKDGPYEVHIETKGASALAAAKSFKPNLIIMDIVIPDLSGCEVTVQIRKDLKVRNTPIIFLSELAKKNETEIYAGIVDGEPFVAKPVLPKPVKTKDLIKAIEESLSKPVELPPLPEE